jgi:hypothetical protein
MSRKTEPAASTDHLFSVLWTISGGVTIDQQMITIPNKTVGSQNSSDRMEDTGCSQNTNMMPAIIITQSEPAVCFQSRVIIARIIKTAMWVSVIKNPGKSRAANYLLSG